MLFVKQKILLFSLLFFIFANLSAQDLQTYTSPYIPKTDSVLVFTPKNYQHKQSYPAVFMLHGWSGNFRGWSRIVDLQGYADKYNFIIICPDGFYESWYLDSPKKPNWQYETYFFKKLLPSLKKQYSMDTNRLFITGLSMGGHGAMYLFLRHSEVFLSAGSTSGVLDLSYSALRRTSIPKLLGKFNLEKWKPYIAIYQLDSIKNKGKHIIFDCGTEDHLYKANNAFRKRCNELQINATYITRSGRHTRTYWRGSIQAHFDFFKKLSSKN